MRDRQFLGRGENEGAFVNRHKETGWVEVTLRDGAQSVTIKREIVKGKTGGAYSIDGHKKSKEEVKKFAEDRGIKIENQCNFLLQEKIAEFAKLAGDAPKLLHEVEKAVGPPDMEADHNTLVRLMKEKNSHEQVFPASHRELSNLATTSYPRGGPRGSQREGDSEERTSKQASERGGNAGMEGVGSQIG